MKKILVETDFSELAENALVFASRIALKIKSDLILFHSRDEKDDRAEFRLKSRVEQLQKEFIGISVTYISTGKYFNSKTVQEIIGAENLGLVVIGTNGDDASFDKKLFGNNSAEIAEGLKCPVLIIPGSARLQKTNKIAYASDLNNLDKELPVLIKFAEKLSAEIQVFHVGPIFPDLVQIDRRNIRKEIESIGEKNNFSNVSFYSEQTDYDNQTHKGIKHFVKKHVPDILVLFHDERKGFDKFISLTETDKAATDFDFPVMVFPK